MEGGPWQAGALGSTAQRGGDRDTEGARERGMPVTVTRTDAQDRRADREQNLP